MFSKWFFLNERIICFPGILPRIVNPLVLILLALCLQACYHPTFHYDPWRVPDGNLPKATEVLQTNENQLLKPGISQFGSTPAPEGPTPTPDIPHLLPTLRTQMSEYVVKSGDTLARIALLHQVSVAQILEVNKITNPDLIESGQKLMIPPASTNELANAFKIIPDSELFYSPSSKDFDSSAVISQFNGTLSTYTEVLENDRELRGSEIVQRVAKEFSINPRLLLAVLDYRSEWLSSKNSDPSLSEFPMGFADPNRKGLYKQLSWAANEMTRGYTLWQQGDLAVWTLADGSVLRIDPTINGGTAGIQYLFSLLYEKEEWKNAVSRQGLYMKYQSLFGFPFSFTFEPLIPSDLVQPELSLPFVTGDIWYLTGGPHEGWGTGSAWAGLDFAPSGEEYGCYESEAPVSAISDGLVVRSENGAVVLDLDGDGFEQTGWSILYMHIATEGRAAVGKELRKGDLIGYPSCEGGYTTGTHLHIARRFNGVWIAADEEIPFNLDGWVSSGTGVRYEGYLTKDGQTIEAFDGRADFNQIGR